MAYDTTIGTMAWINTNYLNGDTNNRFTGILTDEQERGKQKRPAEIGVAALMAASRALELTPFTQSLSNSLATPTPVKAFVENLSHTPEFNRFIVAIGTPAFFLAIARHILGDDLDAFRDEYAKIRREIFERLIQPIRSANTGTFPTVEAAFNARRLSDVLYGMVFDAQELADKMAQDFLIKAGYSGDNFLQATVLNSAFVRIYDEWIANVYTYAAQLMGQGGLMAAVKRGEKFLDRVTIYRRKTEQAPRLTLTRTPTSGDDVAFSVKYRDKSSYLPVRDFVAAGYLSMAYSLAEGKIVPVVESDDINSLMLDLVVPLGDTPTEKTVQVNTAPMVVARNPGVRFRTEHIERYLNPDGFASLSEIASYQVDSPKGIATELFSIGPTQRPVGTTPYETLQVLQNPEFMTSAVMFLLGEHYNLSGLGAIEYGSYFAAQVFGAIIPYDSDSGKIVITVSDEYQAPSRMIELPKLVRRDDNDTSPFYLDKEFARRIAVDLLGLPESVVPQSEVSLLGSSLLTYYLAVLKTLGFEEVAQAIASAAGGYARENRASALGDRKLIMSWTGPNAFAKRTMPLAGVLTSMEIRQKLALLQVFLSKVGNDRVLKALVHAISIYVSYTTDDLSDSVEELWRGSLTGSLL